MKRVLLATALAAGASGVASADDSSMSRVGGDSYGYFNGQPIDNSPSAWRQANPQGLSEQVLQADSGNSVSSAWQLDNPVFTTIASDVTFKQTHPGGLSEREFQALSSEAPAWHPDVTQSTAMASNDRANVALQTFEERVARVFGSNK
jgi:hypothetical protein